MLKHGESTGGVASTTPATGSIRPSLLDAISAIAASPLDAKRVVEKSSAAIHAHYTTLSVEIRLANRECTHLRVSSMRGIPDSYLAVSGLIPVDADHIIAEVFRTGEALQGSELSSHPLGSSLARDLHSHDIDPGWYLVLPLVGHARTVGVLVLTWRDPRPLNEHDTVSLASVADVLAKGVENAYLYEDERGVAEIARRHSAESQALASEFGGIFESITDAVIVFDQDGAIVRANRAANALFDFDPVGWEPRVFLRNAGIHHTDGVPASPQSMPCHEALGGATANDVPLSVYHGRENERRVLVSASPIFNDGVVSAVVSVWRDITERETLIETLAHERRRVEDILASITDGFAVLDRDGFFQSVNASFAKMFGVSMDDTIGRRLLDVFPTVLGSMVERSLLSAIIDDSQAAFVQYYAPADLWAEIRVYPAPDGVTLFVSDVSERRLADQERERLLTAYQVELTRTSLLKDIAATAGSSLSVKQVCRLVIDTIRAHLDPCQGILHLHEDSADMLVLAAHFGMPEYAISTIARMPADSSSAVGHLLVDHPVYMTHDTPGAHWPDPQRADTVRWILLPIHSASRPLGALWIAFEGLRPFTHDEISLFRGVAGQIAAALDNARLYQREHRIADTLQRSLLAESVRVRGIETGRVYRSATEHVRVGGDFYDIYPLPDGRAGITVGDVSGKGLRAASVTGLVRNTLRACALDDLEPHDVVRRANAVLCYFSDREVFATAVYGVVDPVTGLVLYCNGGHPAPVIARADGTVTVLGESGPMIGAMEDLPYTTGHDRLGDGDTLVLYTDGVTEARRGEEFYGEERVAELLRSMGDVPPESIARAVADSAARFGGGVLRDDVAVVALRLTGKTIT